MARRNGLPFDLCWAHVDLSHPRANDVLAAASAVNNTKIPGALTSVTRNLADTEALVKVAESAATFNGNLPGAVRNAIIRTFTEADHAEAVAMMSTPEWYQPWR